MQAPCIIFYNTTQCSFRYNNGYERVLITEFEIFFRQGREVITSFKSELIKRHHDRTSDQPNKFSKYYKRLYNIVKELNIKKRLNSKAAK